jgi:cupin superfamily protein
MAIFVSRLGKALGELFDAEFLDADLSENVVFGKVDPHILTELLSWNDLNELLTRGSVDPAEIRLSRGGCLVPENKFMTTDRDAHKVIDLPKVTEFVRAGASLIIDSLDRIHPRIRAATDDVMRIVGEAGSCNMFATFGHEQAFASHYDEVDTFIVQVIGTKNWTIHGPSEPHPLPEYGDSDPECCPTKIVFEKRLEPGDVIHVPRGWWHTVRGGGDTSLHLTFTFTRRTGYDWLRWIVRQSLCHPEIRESLHRRSTPGANQQRAERLINAFLSTATAHSIDDFFATDRQYSLSRGYVSLPWDVIDAPPPIEAHVELATILRPTLEINPGEVTITANGQTYTLPGRHGQLCEILINSRHLTINELATRASTPLRDTQSLVSALLRSGLVTVNSNDSARLIS